MALAIHEVGHGTDGRPDDRCLGDPEVDPVRVGASTRPRFARVPCPGFDERRAPVAGIGIVGTGTGAGLGDRGPDPIEDGGLEQGVRSLECTPGRSDRSTSGGHVPREGAQ